MFLVDRVSLSTSNSDKERPLSSSGAAVWIPFVRKSFLYCGFLTLVLGAMDRTYNWALLRGTFYKQQWVNSFENEAFDVVILGSSRSLTTIDAIGLQNRLGTRVINLSLDGSGPVDQLCLLRLFLEDNRNTAKKLLFQVDHWALSGPGSAESSYRVFLPFRNHQSVSRTLAAAFPEQGNFYRLRDLVPMASYARCNAYWSFDKVINSIVNLQRPPFDRSGSYLIDRELPKAAESTVSIGPAVGTDDRTVHEIVTLAENHGIEVLMFTAPWLDRRDAGGWRAAADHLRAIDSDYRDFGDLYRGNADYFYDLSHLNRRGAETFTNQLAEFLECPVSVSAP